MKTFLSAILIFLASFGFAAELVQLDKLTTEIKAKESSASDENSEEGKKQKDADEKMSIIAEAHFISFAHSPIRSFYNINFTEGFVSSPFNPPDNSWHFTPGSYQNYASINPGFGKKTPERPSENQELVIGSLCRFITAPN